MPDFTARFSAGVTSTVWDDHPGIGSSRINPQPTHPSNYQQGTVGTPITVLCTIGGVEAPLDGALGGHLFSSDFAEHPCPYPILAAGAAGQSSAQSFTPSVVGHYLWVIRHNGGGAIALHLDVE